MLVTAAVVPKAAAIAAAVVVGHTTLQRWTAMPVFRAHRLLRELRPIGGNGTVAWGIFDKQLKPIHHQATNEIEDSYPTCLWESPLMDIASHGVIGEEEDTRILMRKKLLVKTKRIGKGKSESVSFAVYGRKPQAENESLTPSQRILQSIASKIPNARKPNTMTDPVAFVQWMAAMSTLRESSSGTTELGPGTYRFCFRDYWNYEEEWLYACQRWGWQSLLVQPMARSQFDLQLKEANGGSPTMIRLVERSRLLCGLIPFRLMWTGTIKKSKLLDWDYSEMCVGYKRLRKLGLYKVIPRPAPSEKLRKAPWRICGGGKDWFVVEREGYGMLTFATESMISQRRKES